MNPTVEEPPAKKSRREETQADGPVVFDEPGELLLVVGAEHVDEPEVFSVCPKALSRLSKVFAKMLNGGFAESRPGDEQEGWEIELPEDKPESLRVLMDIMHGRVHEVPKKMELTDLWDVIIAADKYDVLYLLRPWGWDEAVKDQTDNLLLLGVAWYFKNYGLFSQMMVRIAENCFCQDGEIYCRLGDVSDSGVPRGLPDLLGSLVPDRIIDLIPDLRQRLVAAELRPYAEFVQSYVRGSMCLEPGEYAEYKRGCDHHYLAVVVKGFLLQGINVTLQQPYESYSHTVRELKRILEDINASSFGRFLYLHSYNICATSNSNYVWHPDCDERLRQVQKKVAQDALKNPIEPALSPEDVARFQ